MKIGEENVKKIQFDHVHLIGQKQESKTRVVVARFNPSFGKGIVMRHIKNLDKNKRFGVNEQPPRELEEKKKHILPKSWEALEAQKKPKWAMDKLIVESKVTQVKQDCKGHEHKHY